MRGSRRGHQRLDPRGDHHRLDTLGVLEGCGQIAYQGWRVANGEVDLVEDQRRAWSPRGGGWRRSASPIHFAYLPGRLPPVRDTSQGCHRGKMGSMNDFVVRRVRPWARLPDSPLVDVVVRARADRLRSSRRSTARIRSATPRRYDGGGGLLLPAFADVHAHLDSTRLGLPFRPHTAEPGLLGLIENDRRNWRGDGSVAERAIRTLGATVAAGTVRVRSHAQVDADAGLERVDGVLAARAEFEGRCRVQVVAFPQSGIIRDPPTADLLGAAVDAGADLVGGIDPCAFDRDPVAHLDIVFGLAERKQVGVDLHLHEVGELGAFTIELIAERTRALGRWRAT